MHEESALTTTTTAAFRVAKTFLRCESNSFAGARERATNVLARRARVACAAWNTLYVIFGQIFVWSAVLLVVFFHPAER